MAFADLRQQFQSFFAAGLRRKVHVLQDQVHAVARQDVEGLAGAGGAQRFESGLLEQQGQRDQDRAIVVDDEDARRA